MKTKLLSTLVVLCCFMAVSFGQRDQGGGHHKGKGTIEDRINSRLDKMDEVVKFTGNQRNDLKVLLTDLAKKKKDAFCANEIGTDGMKNAMKDINKEKREGVKKILSADQIKLLKSYMKTKKEERKNNGHHNNTNDTIDK